MKVTEGYDEEMEMQIEKELREENMLYFIDLDRFTKLEEELSTEKERLCNERDKMNNELRDNIVKKDNECAYLVSALYKENKEFKELSTYVDEMKDAIEHERRIRRYTYWLNRKKHINDVKRKTIALKELITRKSNVLEENK